MLLYPANWAVPGRQLAEASVLGILAGFAKWGKSDCDEHTCGYVLIVAEMSAEGWHNVGRCWQNRWLADEIGRNASVGHSCSPMQVLAEISADVWQMVGQKRLFWALLAELSADVAR